MPARFLCILFLCVVPVACQSGEKREQEEPERSFRPPPLESELPDGTLWRTARRAAFEEMLEEIAEADLVYVGGNRNFPEHRLLQLRILEYLLDRGRLHGVALLDFTRVLQPRLDAHAKGGDAGGIVLGPYQELGDFARKHRLPMLALGVETEVEMKVREGGLAALSEDQKRSLPAVRTDDAEHRKLFDTLARHGSDREYVVHCMVEDVAADGITRWFRSAPEGAQLLVLCNRIHVADRHGLPERTKERIGLKYRTVVAVGEGERAAIEPVSALAHADFVWITPR